MWGAVVFNKQKIYLHHIQGLWPSHEDYESSVRAEPQGMIEALFRLKHLMKDKVAAILTDHENLVYASESLFVHNYFYNRCLSKVEETKAEIRAEVWLYFLEGVKNNADAISRNKDFSPTDAIFPKVEGSGLGPAFTSPQWQT